MLWALLSALAIAVPAASARAQTCAYVANEGDDTISVIDVASGSATVTVPVGDAPHGVASGSFGGSNAIYVANSGDGTVSRIDPDMLTSRTVNVGTGPEAIAVLPNGLRAYVSHPANGTVSVLDTTALEVTGTITTGGAPTGMEASADGATLYVADGANDKVIVIDTDTNAVVTRFDSGADPVDVAVGAGSLFVSGMPIAVLDTDSGEATGILTAGSALGGAAAITDGRFALVCTSGSGGGALLFVGIDPSPTLPSIALGAGVMPIDVAPLPDGRHAYVTDRDGDRVLAVDLVELDVDGPIPTGDAPHGIAIASGPTGCRPAAPATPTVPPSGCAGDCSGDGEVTINEIILGVNIALGAAAVDECPAFDGNGDGDVAINELIAAVNAALTGCPS
ncbi:MAG: YncE family protein [Deltaproteobacteria bacterium]|nr:YncE family protein [Deltaproteobacteria bacterium]